MLGFPTFVVICRAAALALVAAATCAMGASGAETGRQLRVAYVTDFAAAPDPHDLRGIALLGFQRAVKDFHVVGRVVQFDPKQGAEPTLTLLARQRYDLTFVGDFRSKLDVNAVNAVARRFPSSSFVITDPPLFKRWAKNVQGSIWHVEQPAYLAGYLAGAMERRRPGKDVVGSVGGFPLVPVDAFIACFEAGARHANPGITVLRKYAYGFDTVQALVQGRLRTGGNAVWDLRNGAVGLGRISPRVPRAVLRELDRVRAQIEAGRITVPTGLARS